MTENIMKALIIDDDRVLADILAFAMRREGFQVIQAYDGASALELWAEAKPNLIILDINLPGIDGFTVCQQIRKETDTPIIMVSVRSKDEDVVRGLELGADDYITKPFSPRQLVARTYAVLRRARQLPIITSRQAGDLLLEPGNRVVRIAQGEPISLTPLEGKLIDFLVVNAGKNLPYDSIIDHVWGPQRGDRDMLRQLVHRLRRKIETDPANPLYIQTIPGLGYRLIGDDQKDNASSSL